MKLTNVEKKENNQVELTITVEKDEFEAAMQKAYKKNVGSINIQGFRKGKAPRKMIEKLYGTEIFYEDAINFSYPEAYQKAINEAELEPVDRQPALTDFDVKDGEFTFKAVVTVKPEMTLTEYKGLEAEKPAALVTDEEVDAEIQKMADRNARQVPVERMAQSGDVVKFDFEGFVDDKPFDGGKAENYELTLGSGMFIPGFEEQLEGHGAGEELQVNVTFPEDYHEENLKGKPALFKCKIHEIQEIQKPVLDDEFAKDISEFDTLDEYKQDLKSKMIESAEVRADRAYEEAIMDKLAENLEGNIPEVMFESQLDQIVSDFGYRMSSQGIDFDTYLKMNGMEMDSFRKLFRAQAERQVKVRLALETVARLEGFSVSDEDTEKEFSALAEQYNMPLEQVKTLLAPVAVKADLAVQKAVEFVKENAKVAVAKKTKKTASKKASKKVSADEASEADENATENVEDKE
ncbi:MAG: trigger factor [Clostridiaceae bacterium]|nr:trigger factor [Clostridiaceae bacterium]